MKQIVLICILLLGINNLYADSVEEQILETTNSMQKLMISKDGIPQQIIKQAQGIVIIPSSIKVSWFIGGKYGEGLATIKKADGSWSNPIFITLGGGSLGLQFGFESSDTILVFRTKNSVKELLSRKFTLGAGASVSAGPLGKNVERNTEINMQAEIFSYTQSKGLFIGASLEGASISNNDEKNRALYGNDMKAVNIINKPIVDEIYSVKEFIKTINSFTKE